MSFCPYLPAAEGTSFLFVSKSIASPGWAQVGSAGWVVHLGDGGVGPVIGTERRKA